MGSWLHVNMGQEFQASKHQYKMESLLHVNMDRISGFKITFKLMTEFQATKHQPKMGSWLHVNMDRISKPHPRCPPLPEILFLYMVKTSCKMFTFALSSYGQNLYRERVEIYILVYTHVFIFFLWNVFFLTRIIFNKNSFKNFFSNHISN